MVPPGSSLVEIDLIEQPDGTLMRLSSGAGLRGAAIFQLAGPGAQAGPDVEPARAREPTVRSLSGRASVPRFS